MPENHLCVDIGTNLIKVLEKSANGAVLKWGILERKNKQFHSSIVMFEEKDTAQFLQMLLEKMGTVSREVVIVMPDFLYFTMIADNPNPENIPAAPGTFHFQAFEFASRKFFLVAVPKDIVEKYARIFQVLNLKIKSIELESFVLARVLGKEKESALIVNIGNNFSSFIVAQEGFPIFISKTDFGMASGEWDVIINKVKKIAAERKIKKIIAAAPFDALNGI